MIFTYEPSCTVSTSLKKKSKIWYLLGPTLSLQRASDFLSYLSPRGSSLSRIKGHTTVTATPQNKKQVSPREHGVPWPVPQYSFLPRQLYLQMFVAPCHCSGLRPPPSATPSVLDTDPASSWISCCWPEALRLQAQAHHVLQQFNDGWGEPTQSPGSHSDLFSPPALLCLPLFGVLKKQL